MKNNLQHTLELESTDDKSNSFVDAEVSQPPYDIIVIDPPWDKRKGGLRKSRPNQDRKLNYETLPTKEIFKLLDEQIFPLASKTHTVFIWTIDEFLRPCEDEMELRNYKRHARMIWDKQNGIAPAFTIRYTHEYLLWYYKPQMLKIEKSMRGKFADLFSERAREHSRKPDIAYEIIDKLYPNMSKIDVFSREPRTAFAQFGNEPNYYKRSG